MKINLKALIISFILFHILWSIFDVISLAVRRDGVVCLLGFLSAIIGDFWGKSIWITLAAIFVAAVYGYIRQK